MSPRASMALRGCCTSVIIGKDMVSNGGQVPMARTPTFQTLLAAWVVHSALVGNGKSLPAQASNF